MLKSSGFKKGHWTVYALKSSGFCFDGTSSSEENSNMRQKLHLTGLKCTDISVVNENVVNYSVVIKSVVNEGVVNYSVVNGIQFQ